MKSLQISVSLSIFHNYEWILPQQCLKGDMNEMSKTSSTRKRMSVRPMTGMGGNKRKRCAVFDEKDESLTMVSIHCLLINIKYYTCKIRVANIVHLFNIKANFFYG